MSFRERLKNRYSEKTVCILLVRGQNTEGGPIYAYVAVRADKLEEFMAAQQSGTFFPEDYGVIVASGENNPPPDVVKMMEEEYGFNHEGMLDIPSSEKAKEIVSNLNPNDNLGKNSDTEDED